MQQETEIDSDRAPDLPDSQDAGTLCLAGLDGVAAGRWELCVGVGKRGERKHDVGGNKWLSKSELESRVKVMLVIGTCLHHVQVPVYTT